MDKRREELLNKIFNDKSLDFHYVMENIRKAVKDFNIPFYEVSKSQCSTYQDYKELEEYIKLDPPMFKLFNNDQHLHLRYTINNEETVNQFELTDRQKELGITKEDIVLNYKEYMCYEKFAIHETGRLFTENQYYAYLADPKAPIQRNYIQRFLPEWIIKEDIEHFIKHRLIYREDLSVKNYIIDGYVSPEYYYENVEECEEIDDLGFDLYFHYVEYCNKIPDEIGNILSAYKNGFYGYLNAIEDRVPKTFHEVVEGVRGYGQEDKIELHDLAVQQSRERHREELERRRLAEQPLVENNPAPRRRGRPRIHPLPDPNQPKRPRGRPRKNPLPNPEN